MIDGDHVGLEVDQPDLCGTDPELAARTLGLGSTQIDELRRNHHLRASPTARADAIYTGVLYDSLDVASLDPAARRRACASPTTAGRPT